MDELTEEINKVLAEWNPLELPDEIAAIEYAEYVPLIQNSLKDSSSLQKCLEHIAYDRLGHTFNVAMKSDIRKTCQKLHSLCPIIPKKEKYWK